MTDENENKVPPPLRSAAEEIERDGGDDDELFTSAEYSFEHLTRPRSTAPAPEQPTSPEDDEHKSEFSEEAPTSSSEHDTTNHSEHQFGHGMVVPPPAPPQQTPKLPPVVDTDKDAARRDEPDFERSDTAPPPMSRELPPPLERAQQLPGKDTQSVVVDMGQLNEENERKAREKAAQRAAFAPLESSGAMERITFSNLAALNFSDAAKNFEDDDEDDDEVGDGSTVNLNRADLNRVERKTSNIDASQEPTGEHKTFHEKPLKRPGRWIFQLFVIVFVAALGTLGFAVSNLGKHQDLLTRKPILAIKMGLGLEPFPKPPAPKKAPVKMKKVTGSLIVKEAILQKTKGRLTVSGTVFNQSNVSHDQIELSVQILDKTGASVLIQRIKCCDRENTVQDKEETSDVTPTAEMPEENTVQAAEPAFVLAPGKTARFSHELAPSPKLKADMNPKVSIFYSEVSE